jgi:hypothetical protein
MAVIFTLTRNAVFCNRIFLSVHSANKIRAFFARFRANEAAAAAACREVETEHLMDARTFKHFAKARSGPPAENKIGSLPSWWSKKKEENRRLFGSS